jgi:Ulp1 family protease
LDDEARKLGKPTCSWERVKVKAPYQGNGNDCGLFTLLSIEMLLEDWPLMHEQYMMPMLRIRIGADILFDCKATVVILHNKAKP